MTIAYPDGLVTPEVAPWDVPQLLGIDQPTDVFMGWAPAPPSWAEDTRLQGRTIMGGYGLRNAVADGRVDYVSIRLGSIPRVLHDVVKPTACVVSGVRRGRDIAYSSTVGWAPAAVAASQSVIVEIDNDRFDLGAPLIEGTIDHVVDRTVPPIPVPDMRAPSETDRIIGGLVASLIPEGASIQAGPGGIGESIIAALTQPVSVRTGLITDAMARLHERGLLVGNATAGHIWGDQAIEDLARAGRLELQPVETTHSVSAISAIPRMVACNTALQVGHDGSINVERVGGRLVGGVGGHADFCTGASRSTGGLSIIALQSTTSKGVSTIVPKVDVVSTARCDIDVIITEHGIADLRGLGDTDRANLIRSIAAPEFR